MARTKLALPAVLAALALTAALATSVVVAQQSGPSEQGTNPPQAAPGADSTGQGYRQNAPREGRREGRRNGPERGYNRDSGEDTRDFEDYAGDDRMQRGNRREQDGDWREGRRGRDPGRDDEGQRGPRRQADSFSPPAGMMGRPMFAGACGPAGGRMAGLMLMHLERLAAPTEAQRPAFDKLKAAAEKAHEIAQAGCPTERAITPSGRLAAAEKRLTALLEAVRTVRPALDEFFAQLSEEQKAHIYAATGRLSPRERYTRRRDRQGGESQHPREQRGERRDRWRDGQRDEERGGRQRGQGDDDGWPQWRGRS